MVGTIVHLAIAEKIYRYISDNNLRYCFDESLDIDKNYFIAGNICPDGIMARKNYVREMKLHTHFRDGIPDGTFGNPGTVELFEERMHAFWHNHLDDEKICPGLYLGYITHMMADEKFILGKRNEFFEAISVTGLTDKDRETFVVFNEETDMVDYKIINDMSEISEAKKSLERVEPYEIKGMITKEELTDSRKWILNHFFYAEHELKEPVYLRYDGMRNFIENVTDEIIERIVNEGYLTAEKLQ